MKTTEKHFKIFVDRCKYWVDKFHLDNWEVHYIHSDECGYRAKSSTNLGGYVANIHLSSKWNGYNSISEEDLDMVAKHEVIHVLLARLSSNAKSRYMCVEDLVESEEEIVRKLEKLL